jgi:FKBP-type peptidyl-prolyl cis-trans isomerase FkpA
MTRIPSGSLSRSLRSLRMVAFAAVFSTLASCGKDATAPTIEQTTFAASLNVDLSTMTKLPSGMYIKDLVVGTGKTVTPGDNITARYIGWLANGTEFDRNEAPEAPIAFGLGAGDVILGWDLGIDGMKVGGKRQLVIPPALGYGKSGRGTIPGNAVLVFVVDLISG